MAEIYHHECVSVAMRLHGPSPASSHGRHSSLVTLTRSWILHRFVDGENETSGFRRSCYGVDLNHRWLPNAGREIVRYVLSDDVHTVPNMSLEVKQIMACSRTRVLHQ